MNCNRSYSHQPGLSRHKKVCMTPQTETQKSHNDLSYVHENERLNKVIEDLQRRVEEMERTPRQNIVNNNSQVNIAINGFGLQDRSYITERFLNTCVRQCGQGIVELAKAIHFHPDHPENSNLKADSISAVEKHGRIQVYNGKKWNYEDVEGVLRKVFDNHLQILDGHLNDNADELRVTFGTQTFNIVDGWYDGIRNYHPQKSKEFKKVTNNLKLMILSNTKNQP